jgi:hypothetical protein
MTLVSTSETRPCASDPRRWTKSIAAKEPTASIMVARASNPERVVKADRAEVAPERPEVDQEVQLEDVQPVGSTSVVPPPSLRRWSVPGPLRPWRTAAPRPLDRSPSRG